MTHHIELKLPEHTPRGPVKKILSGGVSGFVGMIDETAVCKFAKPGDAESMNDILIENKIYQRLSKHKNILSFYGKIENGIVLEYAQPVETLTIEQCMTLVEVTRYIHSKGVLH
ncbi:hypothetical protein GGI13_002987, partial [Coemansia sp. RSA 455]